MCLGELGMENEILRETIARLEGGVPFQHARATAPPWNPSRVMLTACISWWVTLTPFGYRLASISQQTLRPRHDEGGVPASHPSGYYASEPISRRKSSSRHSVSCACAAS
jgi:hypothetical protein